MTRLSCVLVALAACGGSAPPVEHRAAPADPEPAAVAPPTPALMARIAAGELALRSLVDPSAGLLYAGYYTDPSEQDPRADDTGLVKIAERACGDRLDALVDALGKQTAAVDGVPWRCAGWVCRRDAPGEYTLDERWRFAGEAGALRLVEVVNIEGGPVTEDFVREGEAWTAAALEALGPGSCR